MQRMRITPPQELAQQALAREAEIMTARLLDLVEPQQDDLFTCNLGIPSFYSTLPELTAGEHAALVVALSDFVQGEWAGEKGGH